MNPCFKFHRKEFLIILRAGLIRAYNLAISLTFSNTLIMFIVFTAFTATGGTLTPRRVFTTLVVPIRRSMLFLFVRGIFQLSERKVADNRIQVRHISCWLSELSLVKYLLWGSVFWCLKSLCKAPHRLCECVYGLPGLYTLEWKRFWQKLQVVNTLNFGVSVPAV